MTLTTRKLKVMAFLASFLLIGGGRFISTGEMSSSALMLTLLFSCTALLTVNLVLATGDLKRTLGSIRILICLMAALFLAADFLSASHLLLTAIVIFPLIFIRQKTSRQEVFFITEGPIPRTFSGKKPLERFIESLFRLFPHPVQPGLYPLNSPGASAPLIITGNFSLTVRTVCTMMADRECWILICDSRGINIWCSTLAGHFNTDTVLKEIDKTGLKDRFHPAYGVLPLLGAAGLSPERISRVLGVPVCFGPLGRAPDGLSPSLKAEERTVRFPLKNRLEMALGAPFLAVLFNGIIYNAMEVEKLLFLIPFIYAGSLFQSLFIVKKHLWLKALLSGGGQGALLWTFRRLLPISPFDIGMSALTLIYLVFEFEGWSPIVKFRIGKQEPKRITLDSSLCTGCGRCVSVCPKNVLALKENKAVIENRQECILCSSCLFQCPENALDYDSS